MNRKISINTFLLVFFYSIGFCILQFFLHKIGMVAASPDAITLSRFDANVYNDVAQHGYSFKDPQVNNTGVYILYPWLCRLLGLGIQGMTILNILLFSIGFTILVRLFEVDIAEQFLWLTTPSLFFMFVPYTEALFFLLMAITFYAMKNKKWWLVWITLFLGSLTRATAIFLIPSLLVTELLANDRKSWLRSVGAYLVHYALPVLLGLFFFVWYQYKVTGDWFRYFHQQREWEGHKFSLPKFPLTSISGGDNITWLSALAILVSLVALVLVIQRVFQWLLKNKLQQDKIVTLCLCYLPIILFLTLFLNPKWGTDTTNLTGMHRYSLCTPFFFVFLYHVISTKKDYKVKHFIPMFLLCNIAWLSCGSYRHIQYFLFFNVNTALVFGYMLHANKKRQWPLLATVAFNLVIQIGLYQQFIQNIYPD